MNVAEIMEQRNAFSFEVFPPKTDVGMEKLCGEGGVLEKLYTLHFPPGGVLLKRLHSFS